MTLLDKIRRGDLSRAELVKLRDNATRLSREGNAQAKVVLDLINETAPPNTEREYVFMGFCPSADFANRQDIRWYEEGVCRFDYIESEHQLYRFCAIQPGDIIILKKREKFGETMRLFGHGRVAQIVMPEDGSTQFLRMQWLHRNDEIVTPLLGCNSTVDVRSISAVENEMPQDFWNWLERQTA